MKIFYALAALIAVLLLIVTPSDATTTYANGTATVDNDNQTYTPVVGTSTTETEAAPSSSTSGHSLITSRSTLSVKNIVVTVKSHIIVNDAADAGYYDMTDASTGYALNTFGPYAKLLCWVLDDANGNTAWTRFPAGDQTLAVGDATATFLIKIAELPKVKRVAMMPYRANIPLKVTYSAR